MSFNNTRLATITMLSIFIIFFSLPFMVLSIPSFTRLQLPSTAVGPESLVFDLPGGGPYTGVSDGRVLKYQGPRVGFTSFAFSSPNRYKSFMSSQWLVLNLFAFCDGTTDPNLGPVCGRPLGLGFNYRRNQLYIADAYFGLLVVGSRGGPATQLATSAEDVPFVFLDGLDVDQRTGIVYFTDASAVYQLRNITDAVANRDATGRLLKYDPRTRNVTVLLRNLSGAAGVAVSRDSTYLLVTEFITGRIQKYWLQGRRANTSEIFKTYQGLPDNIKSTLVGNFWVAVNINQTVPTGQRITSSSRVVQTVNLTAYYNSTSISEVQGRLGTLYIGSLVSNFVGVYRP